jgi:hypothetical protein
MILEDHIKRRVVARAISSAKIRVDEGKINTIVNEIFEYLKLFNTLDEFSSRYLGRDLDKIEIVQELSIFVIPSSVRLIPSDRKTLDVLVKEEDTSFEESASYADFIDWQIKWRNLFKKDITSNMVSLGSLKVPKSLAEVLPIAAFDFIEEEGYSCLVRSTDQPYMPILLRSEMVGPLFRSDYLNASALEVIDDYLAPMIY